MLKSHKKMYPKKQLSRIHENLVWSFVMIFAGREINLPAGKWAG